MQKPIVNVSRVLGLLIPVVLGAAAAGCSDTPSTPLADLKTTYGGASLELVSLGQINVELKVADTSGGCPYLGADVTARFDGVDMEVARGGYDTSASGCYPIAFWITEMPMTTAVAYESSNMSSDMVITDTQTTWTVSSTKMFSNDFVIDNTASNIVWQDVANIVSANVYPGVPLTISDNTISFPPGSVIDSVTAYAHPTPQLCDGPTNCFVDLQGERTYNGTTPGL